MSTHSSHLLSHQYTYCSNHTFNVRYIHIYINLIRSDGYRSEMIQLNAHVYCSGQVSLMTTRLLHNYATFLRTTSQERQKTPSKSAVGKGKIRIGKIKVEHRQVIIMALHASLLSLAAKSCPIVK